MNIRAMAVLLVPALVLSGCGGTSAAGTGDAGDSGAPSASFAASPIDFGLQPCGGAAPAPLSLAIANSGGGTLTYTATLSSTGSFSIQNPSGSLTAGQSANIAVGAAAISATAAA